MYEDRLSELNPRFLVYHTSESQSHLYFSIKSEGLLYVRENVSEPFAATVNISYEIYSDRDKKELIDSATNVLQDVKTTKEHKTIVGRLPLKISKGNTYYLVAQVQDINKKVVANTKILIDKKNLSDKQFFLIKNENNEVCFDLNFAKKQKISIESKLNQTFSANWQYYQTDQGIAKPPFAEKKYYYIGDSNDSTITIKTVNGSVTAPLFESGNYIFNVNNSPSFIVSLFEDEFPKVNSHEQMVKPIRYICTNAEYQALVDAPDKKAAVEAFWLKIGRSKERAKMLIREFYGRVEFANKYFTSYKEGWKTDRGMLSIVMGPPNSISTSAKGETWVYGTSSNMIMSLTFSFDRLNDGFVNEDYQLNRYRSYKDYWYRAVDTWRSGRVYSFN